MVGIREKRVMDMSIESRSRQFGKVFDHWQIKEFLGSGSGGKTAVFRLQRIDSSWGVCALKIVNLIEARGRMEELTEAQLTDYQAAREKCSRNAEREVRLMDELRGNTNIVDYLDHTFVDWSEENAFGRDLLIRMELLTDLRSELRQGKCFAEAEIIKIGRDICTALVRCHSKNILHRDVKPENIFRNKDGDYKLGDFGVSRVLDACPGAVASTGIGTYEYWPAEQMTGSYDKRVDIYSLGLVLYELSNRNRLPFAATTYATGKEVSLRLAGTALPKPTDASPMLTEIILKACAFKPEERYQSSESFLKALHWLSRKNQTSTNPAASEATRAHTSSSQYETVPAEPYKNAFEMQPAQCRRPSSGTQSRKKSSGTYSRERNNREKKKHKAIPIFLVLCAVLCVFASPRVWTFVKYSSAKALLKTEKYEQAVKAFEALGDYRDSPEQLDSARLATDYQAAEALLADGKHEEAITAFEALGNYRDSAVQLENARRAASYEAVKTLLEDGIYESEEFGSYGEIIQKALSEGPDYIQRMRDGTYSEFYLDENDNVLCILYRNLDGTILKKFTAEYGEDKKMLSQRSYDTSDSLGCVSTMTYTKKGKILNQEIKLNDGSVYLTYTYQYRDDGQLETSIVYNSDGRILNKTENYFEGDIPVRFIETNMDGSYDEGTLDEKGCAREICYYNADGTLNFYTENTYDEEGREILANYYNPDGSIRFSCVTDYNAIGNKTRYTCSRPDGEIAFWNEFSYNAIGQVSNMKNYANGGENYYFYEYTCDIAGTLIRETCYAFDGSYSIKHYDVLGNEQELFAYNNGGRLVNHEKYEYDALYNFIGSISTEYYTDGSYCVTQYNSDREHTKEITYNANKTILSSTESFFDDAGRPIKEVTTEADGFVSYLAVFRYEEKTNLVTACITTYNRDGSYVEDYFRNTVSSNVREHILEGFNNNLIHTIEYNTEGIAIGKTEYTYSEDKPGMTVRHSNYLDGSVTVSDVNEKKQIVTQTVYDANGNVMGIMEYLYNDLGQNIRINHKRPSGYLYSYVEYGYNAEGEVVETKWYVPG